jgi:5,10-methylenetetrahydrofolate reductase
MARTFKEALQSGDFVITAEVGPPKGTNIEEMLHHIDLLKDKVDALNVTDNQSSVMRISSLSVAHLIKEKGGESILQMTCRDRNRLALQSELLGAHILGVHNVLCLTGDYVSVGDHPQAKPVFDLDSVQLLQTVGLLNQGKDLSGSDLQGKTNFLAGAVVTPEADPIEPQLVKFRKKIAAGARFIQTQAIYDLEKFKRFMEQARKHDVKIMAGIVLLVSAGMARYMNKNVPGIFVPEKLIDEMAQAPKGKAIEAGIAIAGRMIRQLREEKICDGVHIMAIGKEGRVPDILEAAK